MQIGSHLVCGMFMLVGAEKKIWAGGMTCVRPRQEKVVNAGHDSLYDILEIDCYIKVIRIGN